MRIAILHGNDSQSALADGLRSAHDRLGVRSLLAAWSWRCSCHLHQAREYRGPNSVLLSPLTRNASLDQLNLRRMQDTAQLRDERTVERVHRATCARRCAVQHPRELVARLEDVVYASGGGVLFLVWTDDFGEVGEVFGDEETGCVS